MVCKRGRVGPVSYGGRESILLWSLVDAVSRWSVDIVACTRLGQMGQEAKADAHVPTNG